MKGKGKAKSTGPAQSKGSAPSSGGKAGVSRETDTKNSGKHGMRRPTGMKGNKFTADSSC